MRTKKVRTNYEGVKLDELHTLAGKVVDCLRDSAIFVDLPIELIELETLSQDFQAKWQIAKNGGSKLDNALKDEAKDALLLAFSRLAIYVNQKAEGNLATLLSSGFYLEVDPTPSKTPKVPVLVQLLDGPQKGQLLLKFRKVPATWLYEYQYASEEDADGQLLWSELLATTKTANNILAPVQAGVTYYVRVRARNGKGVSDWSAVVSLLAR
ncbi:fibronectin type III domain-containing protein [Sphingobacterium pedocola]|uniref:Fibronectin type-III domain-containing protein n=1 Tax=Sphingobacterium pedocola TaxID=2082722 RepID=A0ABR9T8A0_9SPHI|nr:fibronectin type III domain-containing protein [Sphingobacterium pedocola]MBE8721574.1 hypothetical protein [Sphingobacterium pedocola]